jgi:hypothetical protein
VLFSLQARGFTHSDMRALLAQLLGLDPAYDPLSAGWSYDLCRLRLRGLIQRFHTAIVTNPPFHAASTLASIRGRSTRCSCKSHEYGRVNRKNQNFKGLTRLGTNHASEIKQPPEEPGVDRTGFGPERKGSSPVALGDGRPAERFRLPLL